MNHELVSHFLHGPTAVLLAIFFWGRWSPFFFRVRTHWRFALKLGVFVFFADCVTAFFYIFFKIVDPLLFPTSYGFFISAIALISLSYAPRDRYEVLTWKKSLLLGAVQGLALLPGVSRMAITFAASRWLRLSNKKTFEISFLIQWPLITAAFVKTVVPRLTLNGGSEFSWLFSSQMMVVIFVASVVAFFGLWLVRWMLYRDKLWIFSLYLCVPIVVWWLLV